MERLCWSEEAQCTVFTMSFQLIYTSLLWICYHKTTSLRGPTSMKDQWQDSVSHHTELRIRFWPVESSSRCCHPHYHGFFNFLRWNPEISIQCELVHDQKKKSFFLCEIKEKYFLMFLDKICTILYLGE